MTREEEKKKARWEYVSKRLANPDFPTYNAEYELETAFDKGAEWADAHPDIDVRTMAAWQSGYKEAIEKACEWLYEYNRKQADKMFGTVHTADVTINVAEFRKAMKSSSSEIPNNCEKGEEDEDHFIDANKKVDRVIGTADHIKTALDVLNKKGGEE